MTLSSALKRCRVRAEAGDCVREKKLESWVGVISKATGGVRLTDGVQVPDRIARPDEV